MQIIDNFKTLFIRNSKLIFVVFTCLLVLVILNLVRVSFSERTEMVSNQFDEIQDLIDDIKNKDKQLYNKLDVVKVQKEVKGIDISAWQGDIDWEAVKASGVDFVMIRCGLRSLANETMYEDTKFKYNVSEANRLDIPVGVYYYSTAISEIEVLEEASYVLNLVKDYKITYPIVYDFETFGQNRAEGLSDTKINKNALRFLDYIRGHGYYAMLYGNQRSLENNWDLSYFEGYDIWLAQYNDVPTYQGDFVMWQYTDRGRVDGINGNVDMDISYYAYEERT